MVLGQIFFAVKTMVALWPLWSDVRDVATLTVGALHGGVAVGVGVGVGEEVVKATSLPAMVPPALMATIR